jgi:hypothetical protein
MGLFAEMGRGRERQYRCVVSVGGLVEEVEVH